jgi:outer membrane protein OmpA-like peptidoglycan-associated protein
MMRVLAIILVSLLPVQSMRAAEALRFIACPVYRNTDSGKKSGCWLAVDPATGTRYDISVSPTKPDWNFAVLVEGVPEAGATDPCGGVVLRPARVSVLPGQQCARTMIPAEGFSGRPFVLPERNVHPLYARRDPATPPFQPRTFAVTFDFGSDFITYQLTDYYLDQIAYFALDAAPVRVEIVGRAANQPALVSGQRLAESVALARSRADKVAEWMRRRGIPPNSITVTSRANPEPVLLEAADGLLTPSLRRVEVTVTPLAVTSAAKE